MNLINTQSSRAHWLLRTALAVALTFSGLGLMQKAEAAQTPVQPTTHSTAFKTVEINGVEIFYREAGPKDAPTILLLHGFPTTSLPKTGGL